MSDEKNPWKIVLDFDDYPNIGPWKEKISMPSPPHKGDCLNWRDKRSGKENVAKYLVERVEHHAQTYDFEIDNKAQSSECIVYLKRIKEKTGKKAWTVTGLLLGYLIGDALLSFFHTPNQIQRRLAENEILYQTPKIVLEQTIKECEQCFDYIGPLTYITKNTELDRLERKLKLFQ